MAYKSPIRPRCRCCGRLMPKATGSLYFQDYGEGRADHIVVKALPRTLAEAQTFTNLQVISIRRDHTGGVYGAGTWDGESWTDDLFCKVACAERFGRMAASHHPEIQTQDYADRLKAAMREPDTTLRFRPGCAAWTATSAAIRSPGSSNATWTVGPSSRSSTASARHAAAAGDRKLCGICGRPLERDIWMVGGPGSAFHEHGAYLDPPMHHACAHYALRVCPYIASRYTGRIDDALAKHGRWPPGLTIAQEDFALPEQPPFFVMARTLRAPMDTDSGGLRFHPHRPWRAVEYWRLGVQLSDAEARDLLTASETWPWTPADLIHWPTRHEGTDPKRRQAGPAKPSRIAQSLGARDYRASIREQVEDRRAAYETEVAPRCPRR